MDWFEWTGLERTGLDTDTNGIGLVFKKKSSKNIYNFVALSLQLEGKSGTKLNVKQPPTVVG